MWILSTFSNAMVQKHPVSVITDGDLAMQRAIRLVWPNSSHRLCIWHIEQNIVRNLHDDGVKDNFRYFLYECCSIEEIERKWLEFLISITLYIRSRGYIRCMRGGKSGVLCIMLISAI